MPERSVYFISTGRCGTTRLAELLRETLDPSEFTVTWQMRGSHVANVVGNILFALGIEEGPRGWVHRRVVAPHQTTPFFITTDPLTTMVVPRALIDDPNVMIVHVVRDQAGFARSFLRMTRGRWQSWVAHNLVPFWQPGLWPFQNAVSPRIEQVYQRIWETKNTYFEQRYGSNPNYRRISMDDLYDAPTMSGLLSDFFDRPIHIDAGAVATRGGFITHAS